MWLVRQKAVVFGLFSHGQPKPVILFFKYFYTLSFRFESKSEKNFDKMTSYIYDLLNVLYNVNKYLYKSNFGSKWICNTLL